MTAPTDAARPAWRDRLDSLAFPVVAFALFRLSVHFIATLGWVLDSQLRHAPWIERSAALQQVKGFDALFRWDAGWYLTLARDGYSDPRHANFFPAFPLEVRALAQLFSADFHVTAVLTATLNAFIAVLALYLAAEKLLGREGARWTVIAFLAYPFAFFQATAYPESLTVAAGATALALEVHARGRWALLASAASALTRHTSAWSALTLVLRRWQQRERWATRLLPLVAWGLGLSVFCAFLWQKYGNPLMFIAVRKVYWGDAFRAVWELKLDESPMMFPALVFALLPLAGTVFLWRTPALRFLAIPTALWLVMLVFNGGTGFGRHTASTWPAFLGLGAWLSARPSIGVLILGLCAPFGGLMLFLHSHQWHVF